MANEETVNKEDQTAAPATPTTEEEPTVQHDPAIAPALTAGLGAVYLRNKLKAVQDEN